MPGELHPLAIRILHWAIAVLVVAQVIVAWSIPENDTGQSPLWTVHATIGPIILLLALVRIGFRLTTRSPALPPDLPLWQRWIARLNQIGLYVLLIAMPLTGWAKFSVHGNGPLLFGVIQLPPLVSPAPEGADADAIAGPYALAHRLLATLLSILVAAHVAGALHHLLIRRDRVFQSMASLAR